MPSLKRMMMNNINDDESTVSEFDDYLIEMIVSGTTRRLSYSSLDDSTVETVASILDDDLFDVELKRRSFKKVTFGDSTVREYGTTVGACTEANLGKCPMELTWNYIRQYTLETS
jgi:hypothetical protein